MTHSAFTGAIRPLLDVVGIGIPVVRHGIEVSLGNPYLLESIPYGWHQTQGGNFFGIAGVLPQEKARTGCGPFSDVAIGTVAVWGCRVAGGATYPSHMVTMSAYRFFRAFLRIMALDAGRFRSDVPAVCIHFSISMELGSGMAVGTEHSLLVVHVRHPAVLAGKLGIHTTPMAESAGLGFVLPDELVPIDQPQVHSTDDGAFHMTIPAGSMASSAGLFEYLCIENLGFFFRESSAYPLHSSRGVVERKLVGFGDTFMAGSAGSGVVGRPSYQARVGFVFIQPFRVTFVTNDAPVFEVRILFQEIFVNYKTFVQFIRPNRGRSTRSPFPLFTARTMRWGNEEVLHLALAGMAGNATGIHAEQGASRQ